MKWTPSTTSLVAEYITSTSITEKRRVFNKLYPHLSDIVDIILKKYNCHSDDNRQDLLTHLYTNVMDKIVLDKIKASQQFIYLSCRNYTLAYLIKKNLRYDEMVVDVMDDTTTSNTIDFDLKVKIVNEIDEKIAREEVINRTNAIWLLLLKKYLIDNEFDERGTRDYICKEMHISHTTFASIACRVGVYPKYLNVSLIDNTLNVK